MHRVGAVVSDSQLREGVHQIVNSIVGDGGTGNGAVINRSIGDSTKDYRFEGIENSNTVFLRSNASGIVSNRQGNTIEVVAEVGIGSFIKVISIFYG